MAHESEAEFAKLLLSDYKTKYDFQKDAFPLLYNGTIEEAAARAPDYNMMKHFLQGGTQD